MNAKQELNKRKEQERARDARYRDSLKNKGFRRIMIKVRIGKEQEARRLIEEKINASG